MGRRSLLSGLVLLLGVAALILIDGEGEEGPSAPAVRPAERGGRAEPSLLDPSDAAAASAEKDPALPQRRLVLRDLADGGVLDGFAVVVSGGASGEEGRTVRTDGGGGLEPPPGPRPRISAVDDRWRVAGRQDREGGSAVLWLCETVPVDVTVVLEGEAEPGDVMEVTLRAEVLKDLGPMGESATTVPWTKTWLERHGVLPVADLPTPDEDGRARVLLPLVKDLAVSAHRPGWRPAHAKLPPRGPETSIPAVTLRLTRRSLRVTGKLVDEEGNPVCRTQVALYVSRRMPVDQKMSDEEIRKYGHAFTASVSVPKGYARVTWVISTATGRADSGNPGEFVLESNVEGEALLVVLPSDEWRTTRRSLGALRADVDDLRIVLEDASALPRLRIVAGERTLAGSQVVVVDLSAGDAQPAFQVVTAADGTIGTSKLQGGRRYAFAVLGERTEKKREHWSGEIVWDGRAVLDVNDLE